MTPYIFKVHDETYRVLKKKMYQNKFEEGYAYLLSSFNDYVYPYRGEKDNSKKCIDVGIYVVNGFPYVVRPKTDIEKTLYSKNKIITLNPDSIFKNLSDANIDPLIEEAGLADSGDIFKPALKSTDDIALAAMKFAIGNKNNGEGIVYNKYASKFPDMATKNNGRRALTHGNTLKMDMAHRFADVFDLNFGIVVWDKPNCTNPMDPEHKKVYCIFDTDSLLDGDIDDYEFKEIERE